MAEAYDTRKLAKSVLLSGADQKQWPLFDGSYNYLDVGRFIYQDQIIYPSIFNSKQEYISSKWTIPCLGGITFIGKVPLILASIWFYLVKLLSKTVTWPAALSPILRRRSLKLKYPVGKSRFLFRV